MNIVLCNLTLSDITEQYVSWLNDKEVNRYMECRHQKHTVISERHYFTNRPDNDLIFGIYEHCKLIGAISFTMIDIINQSAYIGIFIGDKSYWNKGYGTQALRLAIKYAHETLKIKSLVAGIYENNLTSRKLFEKCGFTLCVSCSSTI